MKPSIPTPPAVPHKYTPKPLDEALDALEVAHINHACALGELINSVDVLIARGVPATKTRVKVLMLRALFERYTRALADNDTDVVLNQHNSQPHKPAE